MNLKTLLAGCALAVAIALPAHAQTAPTLYKRLGGYDAIAAVTDDFLGKLAGDPQLGRFFGGHSSDSLKRIRQNIVDQLCAKGFVTRHRGAVPEDRRAVVLTATDAGVQAVQAVMNGMGQQSEMLAHLFAEVAHWRPSALGLGSVKEPAAASDQQGRKDQT